MTRDYHRETAADIFGKRPEERRAGKAVNTMSMYSGGTMSFPNIPEGMSPERAAKRAREKAELDLIGKIADRATAHPGWCSASRTDLIVLLIQVNAKNKLDLARLLAFPDFDFFHDVGGILDHTRPGTGVLTDFFEPRCGRVK